MAAGGPPPATVRAMTSGTARHYVATPREWPEWAYDLFEDEVPLAIRCWTCGHPAGEHWGETLSDGSPVTYCDAGTEVDAADVWGPVCPCVELL